MSADQRPSGDDGTEPRRGEGAQPHEPVRFGRSPLHRMPAVSVIALAIIIVLVAISTRGPVRWLMLALVLVAALSAWRSARIRARRDGERGSTDEDRT